MALMKCKECSATVSSKAKACPHCGAAVPRKTLGGAIFVGVLVVLVVGAVAKQAANGADDLKGPGATKAVTSPAPIPQKSVAELKADREVNLVLAGARALRKSMKKPETFELTHATMIDGNVICYEYRARNSFNDLHDEIFIISPKGPSQKVADWNNLCANKGGTNYTYVRAVL